MDHEPSRHARLSDVAVPLDGVAYILSGWSGKGALFRALGSVHDPDGIERLWGERAIRRRADRILIEHVRSALAQWPQALDEWRQHLPISSEAQTLVSPVPHGRVDWRETSRRFGWPARSFVTRQRRREIADVTVTTLAWTVDVLDGLVGAAKHLGALDEVTPDIDTPLRAAREALALTNVPEVLPRPDRHDLEALKTSGRPWSSVEPVTSKLLRAETDLLWFATQLLAPDPELEWRLYHLAVLGHTLMALRAAGARIRWLVPMGTGEAGPNFLASFPDGVKIEVWFEAAGAHAHYSRGPSPYRRAVAPVRGAESAIGADIGLFMPSKGRALLLECKYSTYGPYIGRNGFHQAAGYALDAQERWPRVWSYVIGPEEVVQGMSAIEIPEAAPAITLGMSSVPAIPELIANFL